MKDWKALKREWLKNPDFVVEYDSLEPEYKLARSLIKARLAKKLTQAQLAEKAGVGQAVIARLESGTQNPRLTTICRVARALDQELKLVGK